MVAMQMGDQDRVDRIRIDAELLHGDQRGGAAVDEETGGRAGHHEAGIEAAAAAESVAAAEKLKLHACSDFRCIGFIGHDNRISISSSMSYYKEGLLQGKIGRALVRARVGQYGQF